MTRDMDLIRQILLKMEAHPHGYAPRPLDIDGYSEEQIGFHLRLMGEAGLIIAKDVSTFGGKSPQSIPLSLTWFGYEFLEASRKEQLWEKAKDASRRASGGLSFEVLKALLIKLAMGAI